jgi:RNA polymerase-binding transcription factor DksA
MNYDEFMEDQVNKYNAAIDAYNGMSAEAQEELDKKYQDMKNDDGEFYSGYEDYLKQTLLDDPKEALEQYEETMELLEDLGMDYDDLLNEWHDNIIGQIQTKLDTTLEVTEAQLGYLEHKLSRIEDDAYSAAEAIGLMGQQMDIA